MVVVPEIPKTPLKSHHILSTNKQKGIREVPFQASNASEFWEATKKREGWCAEDMYFPTTYLGPKSLEIFGNGIRTVFFDRENTSSEALAPLVPLNPLTSLEWDEI